MTTPAPSAPLRPRRIAEGVHVVRHAGVEALLLLTDPLLAELEPVALEQLRRALELPGLERAVATPDLHPGYAVPIGFTAVSATHLYPDAVGPDPACSVSLSRVDAPGFEALAKPERRAVLDDLEAAIRVTRRRGRRRGGAPPAPLPFEELWAIATGARRRAKTWVAGHARAFAGLEPALLAEFRELLEGLATERTRAQFGSIGGGNHFVEVQLGDDGLPYVMAHFGSRGLGAAGAALFETRVREAMAARAGRPLPEDELLAEPADTQLGRLYWLFQEAMLEIATANHLHVQEAATTVLCRHLGADRAAATFLGHIPHNFIERRGGRYWQRKGATPAYDNDGIPLLIPGSMASASYVLEPGPHAARYGESVPHGAGRRFSRGEARRRLDQEETDRRFDERGVLGSFRHVPLDEATGAYKDVDEVIRAVVVPGVARVVQRLRPVLVLKGD